VKVYIQNPALSVKLYQVISMRGEQAQTISSIPGNYISAIRNPPLIKEPGVIR